MKMKRLRTWNINYTTDVTNNKYRTKALEAHFS